MTSTHTHYLDYRDLRGDGRIVLYKRADHQNPKWTVRLKVPNVSGFVVKSCKTTDDFEARRFAEDLYYQLEGRARRGEPINAPTFRQVYESWSKSVYAERRLRSEKYLNGNVRRVELWALRYFAEYQIDLVTESTLTGYVEWRLAAPEQPEPSTLKNVRTALNQLFRFAMRKGYIRELPRMRIRSGRRSVRPDIPEAEWRRLCEYLNEYANLARDRRRRRERLYLKQYILVLANTGIRVGEARKLRWQDVSSTRTGQPVT